MNVKKIAKGLFTAGLCVFINAQAFAATEPNVFLSSQPINAAENVSVDNQSLLTPRVMNEIAKAVNNKLNLMKQQGKLSFEYKVRDLLGVNNDTRARAQEATLDENAVTIVPVVLAASYYRDVFPIGNVNFYRYQFRTEVSIMFCTYDGELHVVYNVPLAGNTTLGNSVEAGKAITRELTEEQTQNQYILSTTELIDKYFYVPTNIMKFLQQRKPQTYQVANVDITSAAVNGKWDEDSRENFVKSVVATNFTALYAAKHPDFIVLPSKIGHPNWPAKVAEAVSGRNGAGFDAELQNAQFPINLELYKLAGFKIAKKNADTSLFNDIGISVGVKNVTDNKDTLYTKIYRIPNGSNANLVVAWDEIFGDAGKELGAK